MRFSIFALLIVFSVSFNLLFSQEKQDEKLTCAPVESKKANKLFEKAQDKKKYKKQERIELLKSAIDEEPEFAAAYLQIGMELVVNCKLNNTSFNSVVPFLRKAIDICPQIHASPYYYIGFNFYESAKHDSAMFWLQKFLDFHDEDENKFEKEYEGQLFQAKQMIVYAKKEKELKSKRVPFNPVAVNGISTVNSEYLPYLSPDEEFFLYTRTEPDNRIDRVYQTDKEREIFTISTKKTDGGYDKGEPMPYPFNQSSNEGGATLTIDNKYLYYAQSNNEGGTRLNTDIYFSSNFGDGWTNIKKLPNINHPIYWDSQPTVSSDGNAIIFVSDRPGGFGKLDLYITIKDPTTKQWSAPKNLGPKINTPGNEKTPFLHSDSETLYFSSDGIYGYGGLDIYFTRKDEKGEWKTPENIGFPINSESDDAGFFVSTNGELGYFCSWDEGKVSGKGVGKYDIFQFDLYKEARPDAVTFIKGEIKKDTEEPLKNFKVEFKNIRTNEKTLAVVDSTTGSFIAAVNLKKNSNDKIAITASAEQHAFTSQMIEIKENFSFKNPPKLDTMELKKTEKGKSFVLNNIYYQTGSDELFPESVIILNEFASFLKDHTEMKIEIQGHTDNTGNADENIALSQKRADKVVQFLCEKGIEKSLIRAKGYGSQKPIANNATSEGRAKNRRTEFLVLDEN
jgi:outer membrane protein OmpA-like peptidoglycan-associated protein/tetratricopeptide (TPR) repeat protein